MSCAALGRERLCSAVKTRVMNAHNCSCDSKRCACPDTICSTRPSHTMGLPSDGRRNCTTKKVRLPGMDGRGRWDMPVAPWSHSRSRFLRSIDNVCDADCSSPSPIALECRRCEPFMGSAGAFEWQGQSCHGVYFLFMFTTLPFACVCSLLSCGRRGAPAVHGLPCPDPASAPWRASRVGHSREGS